MSLSEKRNFQKLAALIDHRNILCIWKLKLYSWTIYLKETHDLTPGIKLPIPLHSNSEFLSCPVHIINRENSLVKLRRSMKGRDLSLWEDGSPRVLYLSTKQSKRSLYLLFPCYLGFSLNLCSQSLDTPTSYYRW